MHNAKNNKEEWKPVNGYEGLYEVSREGRIRSLNRIVITKTGKDRLIKGKVLNGSFCVYWSVLLYKDGSAKRLYVHRIVGLAFVPNPESNDKVNHIDGNKQNNHYSNLEWCSQQDNIDHAFNIGLKKRSGRSKLFTASQVRAIRIDGRTIKRIAEEYGVSYQTISKIRSRRSYKDIK